MLYFGIELKVDGHTIKAGGRGKGPEEAKVKVFGEFLERISSFSPLDLIKKSALSLETTKREVHSKKVWARSILGAFTFKKFNLSEMYYGIPEEDFRYRKYHKTSNGYAGHFELKKAIVSGWLELIERDSFFVYWLNGIQPKRISLEDDLFLKDKDLVKIKNDINKYNLNLVILDLTSDTAVPVIGCMFHSHEDGDTYVGFGAAAGFSFKEIFIKAYEEALSCASYSYAQESDYILGDAYKPFIDRAINLEKRKIIYLNKNNFQKVKFFFENKAVISGADFISNYSSYNTTEKQLSALRERFLLKSKFDERYKVYYYEINNSLLSSFGYKVVRVICDALYPIYLNENLADIKHPRLLEFQNFMLKNEGGNKSFVNHWPHFFP